MIYFIFIFLLSLVASVAASDQSGEYLDSQWIDQSICNQVQAAIDDKNYTKSGIAYVLNDLPYVVKSGSEQVKSRMMGYEVFQEACDSLQSQHTGLPDKKIGLIKMPQSPWSDVSIIAENVIKKYNAQPLDEISERISYPEINDFLTVAFKARYTDIHSRNVSYSPKLKKFFVMDSEIGSFCFHDASFESKSVFEKKVWQSITSSLASSLSHQKHLPLYINNLKRKKPGTFN